MLKPSPKEVWSQKALQFLIYLYPYYFKEMSQMDRKSIRYTLLASMMFIMVSSIIILSVLWLSLEYKAFLKNAEDSRNDFIVSQKSMLQRDVLAISTFINYRIQQTDRILKNNIESRVHEAHALASHLFNILRGHLEEDQIAEIISEALRVIRFDNGIGYYFIFSMEGTDILFPDRPEMKGNNMLSVQGGSGEYVVRDMLEIVGEKDEGFYTYRWTKPRKEGNDYLKTAYVKYFEPLGWVIGTGSYLDDVTDKLQNEVLEYIVPLQLDEEGYFFGSIKGGYPLFTNGELTRGGGNIIGLTDPYGIPIIQKYNDIIAENGSGFVNYSWPKPENSLPSPKVSFVTEIPEWSWIIGAGVYLDSIEEKLVTRHQMLQKELFQKAGLSVGFLIFVFFLVFIWIRNFLSRINDDFQGFKSLLKRSAAERTPMVEDRFDYSEFNEMAISMNDVFYEMQETKNILKETEGRYQLIFDNSPMGLLYFDEKGKIVECNDSTLQLLGSSYHHLVGLNMLDLPDSGLVSAVKKALSGEKGIYEGVYTSVTGNKTIPVHGFFAPAFKNGNLHGGVGIFEDISERLYAEKENKRLEAQVRQIQKMESVGRLAGGVAHDFNNMLSIIMGYAEIAMAKDKDKKPVSLELKEIYAAATRSANLTRQLLAFARKEVISPEVLNLNKALEGMLQMMRRLIGEDIQLVWRPGKNLWPVQMDPSQLDQILANLCINARDAISGVGTLTIETENVNLDERYCAIIPESVPGRFVKLSVSDNGCGMDKEILEKIFEPFFTTKPTGEGTGLGLATIYGIVRQNGGFISVYSEPGSGSTFTVFFPESVKEGQEPEDVSVSESIKGGDEKILLVEDEEAILKLVKSMLEKLGYGVLAFSNPMEALEKMQYYDGEVHLLISDVIMPGMNGRDMAEELKKNKFPELRTIFTSGYTANIIARYGVLDKDMIFLQKPYVLAALSDAVRKALDMR
ncbi:response regulator [Desulfobotulus mexicanus]|uniref:histidine kinase n=2 Tax=Desulfobotulus mexicanus TaxID=2586642 RepID=A0A5Q4VEF2_9BACT|nr:response regulator [Desulfobotulus mexicanus]